MKLNIDSKEIVSDPDILGGIPILKGHRISIAQILAEVSLGAGLVELSEDMGLNSAQLYRLFEDLARSVTVATPLEVEDPSPEVGR